MLGRAIELCTTGSLSAFGSSSSPGAGEARHFNDGIGRESRPFAANGQLRRAPDEGSDNRHFVANIRCVRNRTLAYSETGCGEGQQGARKLVESPCWQAQKALAILPSHRTSVS